MIARMEHMVKFLSSFNGVKNNFFRHLKPKLLKLWVFQLKHNLVNILSQLPSCLFNAVGSTLMRFKLTCGNKSKFFGLFIRYDRTPRYAKLIKFWNDTNKRTKRWAFESLKTVPIPFGAPRKNNKIRTNLVLNLKTWVACSSGPRTGFVRGELETQKPVFRRSSVPLFCVAHLKPSRPASSGSQ